MKTAARLTIRLTIVVLLFLDVALAAGIVCKMAGTTAEPSIPLFTATQNSTESFYRASVKVRGCVGYGSGIEGWYRGQHIVLTATHVVDCNGDLDIVEEDEDGKTSRAAKRLILDKETDLAVLTVSGEARTGLPDLTPVDEVKVGESVWYAGYGAWTRCWLEQTIVSRPHWKSGGVTGFLVTGKGWYGSSGSGVFVDRGGVKRVAGIMSRWAAEEPDCYGVCPLCAAGPRDIAIILNKAYGRKKYCGAD